MRPGVACCTAPLMRYLLMRLTPAHARTFCVTFMKSGCVMGRVTMGLSRPPPPPPSREGVVRAGDLQWGYGE